MNELLRQWGKNIENGRRAHGYSQTRLAEILNTTQQSVSRWENGQVAPRDRQKVAIAEALHMDVRTLFPLVRGLLGSAA